MTSNITCPACGRVLIAPGDLLGRRVRCGDCGHDFVADARSAIRELAALPTLDGQESYGQSGKATASLVLGILGMICWLLPIIGLPVTIVGLVMGCKGLDSSNRGIAMAGVILSVIGLVATIINAAWGAYLGVTGQHPLLR